MCIRDRASSPSWSRERDSSSVISRRRGPCSVSAVAVKTVSYTHLDVYKRQMHNPGDIRGKTSSLNERDLEDLVNYVQSL